LKQTIITKVTDTTTANNPTVIATTLGKIHGSVSKGIYWAKTN